MKKLLFTAALLISGVASADTLTTFECSSVLDYVVRVNGQRVVRSVDLTISGTKTPQNTLRGGVWVQAGSVKTILNLPSGSFSDGVISFKGYNLKDQVGVGFTFMETQSGEQNFANSVSVKVDSGNTTIIATNDIISLTGEDLGNYPINCNIEQN